MQMIVPPCTAVQVQPSSSSTAFLCSSRNRPRVRCSVSSYNGPPPSGNKWYALSKQISVMAKENPDLGSATLLNQWEDRGKPLSRSDISRLVKELRKFNRHKQALEVYDWMSNREERFRLSSSDAAIQLDLIGKVHGLSSAEDFFHRLPEDRKDNRVYGALLNSYAKARKREQAEAVIEEMRVKGYLTHALPFNVMMTLYMNFKDYDKVESMVSEMTKKNINLDIYSYNIWLSSCGKEGSAEKMERAFEHMKMDKTIYPDCTTFSTMATMYAKMGQLEKAEECLRKVEDRIKGWDRESFHHLLTLYGLVGKKDEVYRVWNSYKSGFPTITNLGYHSLISSLIKVGDVDGAEKMYEEWLSGKTYYDARITNLLMTEYVKEGNFEKAESLFRRMVEDGGKPTANTWEILAEGHIGERRVSEALSCLKEAFSGLGYSKSWRLKPANMSAFSKLCEEEGDGKSKEVLVEMLRKSGHLRSKKYASDMGFTDDQIAG